MPQAPRISLALAIHNHQPVGNFGWVFAEVFDQAYLPLVDALERHPSVRLSLHYTGPLLEWLRAERPAFIERLRALVAGDQVEVLGGGLYEPVLASLPERDRVAQLVRMADAIEATFGRRPTGAWLAERVWEPDLPTSLVAGGYAWTILDDAHFRAAAIPEEALWGPYTTDDQGSLLTVFGTEQGLRYRIPFREVDEVIDYLREHATEGGERVGMMGDDGEKFGAWPTTYEHCWGTGRWVERFFEALEANADWLTTVTPSDWLRAHHPIGRVYVPTGSYAEMGEWALPPDESRAFSAIVHRAQAERLPEARWLRGAFWRNFQVRYREVNDLHKQMLRVSDKVADMPAGRVRDLALDHLHRGQSNDCYWHGLFGGIYISHMRLATHEHLIAAEDLADHAAGQSPTAGVADLDLDGRDEIRLATDGEVVTLELDDGAGIGAWDVRAPRHALGSVLRRRPEAYHATLREQEARAAHLAAMASTASATATARAASSASAAAETPAQSDAAGLDQAGVDESGSVTSIHEFARAKEPNLSARLAYDWHERRAGVVRILAPGPLPTDPAATRELERADFVDAPFEVVELAAGRAVVARDGWIDEPGDRQAVRVGKTIELGGDRRSPSLALEVEVENRSNRPLDALLAIDWPTTMLGGGGNPSAWWEVDGHRTGHDVAGSAPRLGSIAQGNDDIGIGVTTTIDPPALAAWAPIETVSNSEAGFERAYQGASLLLGWPLRLAPGEHWSVRIAHAVTTTRDRALEELGTEAASA